MVYIHLNQTILSKLPQTLPGAIQLIQVDKNKYLKYCDFKLVTRQLKLQLYKYVCRADVISEIDMDKLIELAKRTPQERRQIEQLKNRHQYRLMTSCSVKGGITSNSRVYYYGNQVAGANQSESVRQLTDSMSFGVTFIFTFFMAGITGYYLALYFFHFQLVGCLIVSLVFIFVTIFVETWLYMIKQAKVNHKIKLERKRREAKQGMMAENSLRTGLKAKLVDQRSEESNLKQKVNGKQSTLKDDNKKLKGE